MNITIVTTILNMLLAIIPQLTTNKQINSVVATLVNIVPIITKEYGDLLPIVQNIIAVLQQSSAITPAQLATLKALDAKVDAAFDAQWEAYQAAHPVPVAAPTPIPVADAVVTDPLVPAMGEAP